jgi:hypothetical protein
MNRSISRRGMALMAALVIVSLVAISAALYAQERLRIRRQALRECELRQAQWLAEGAAERARAAIAQDANYEGETWTTALELSGESITGEAVIRVTGLEDSPAERTISIDSRLPLDPILGVRHELSVPFPTQESQP